MQDIASFVLSAPGRSEVTSRCLASLADSDLGPVTVCTNPPGMPPLDHWNQTFDAMKRAAAPMVILFEDDCLVNPHILANLRTWPWMHEPEFGAGWLYNPGGYKGGHDVWYDGTPPDWYGTVAVLYWREDLEIIQTVANRWMATMGNIAWDCAVAWAIHALGMQIRVHGPPLVEHMHEAPSLLGHTHSESFSSTRGSFVADWQRDPLAPGPVKPIVRRAPRPHWVQQRMAQMGV